MWRTIVTKRVHLEFRRFFLKFLDFQFLCGDSTQGSNIVDIQITRLRLQQRFKYIKVRSVWFNEYF